jgi:hypothetical protein
MLTSTISKFNLTIVTWNSNGVGNKLGSLTDFLETHKVDIMAISETKLTPTNKVRLRNYVVHRQDRPNAVNAGGVALLVHKNVPHQKVNIPPGNALEIVGIKLISGVHVYAAYNRPSNRFTRDDLDEIFNTADKVIVAGDFNSKHPAWNCNRTNPNGTLLRNYAEDADIIINYPDEHTHHPANLMTPTTIDLILSNNIDNLQKPLSLPELDSDHNPVKTVLSGQQKEVRQQTKISYKKTDWKIFRDTLNSAIQINNSIPDITALEQAVVKFTKIIQKAIEINTYKVTLNKNQESEIITPQVKEKIKNRNKLKRIWQRTQHPGIKEQINKLNHKIRNEIKTNRSNVWDKKLEDIKINDDTLYKISKLLKKKRAPLGVIRDGSRAAITDAERAELLSCHYSKIHDLLLDTRPMTDEQKLIMDTINKFSQTNFACDETYFKNYQTSPQEIKQKIKLLPNKKAPGEDEIPNIILKNLPQKAIVQINYIINAIIRLQHFPQTWKNAIVIPIPKTTKNSDPGNFRPISLLNTLAKLTEKIILDRLIKLDKKYNMTRPEQFGFRPGHDTTQQVARIANDIAYNYNKDKVTAMTLLDIQKAFDRVWVQGLTYKLLQKELPVNFIKLIQSYLNNRTLQVKVESTLSDQKPIKAGVPQGSILGPKLFSIYINDIPKFTKTNLALYADDTAVYAHSFNAEVANKQVQIQVNLLEDYFDKWLIGINSAKTETILFSKKFTNNKIITPLKLKEQKIITKPSVKYLGVHLDSRLTFHTHVNKTLEKARKTFNALFPLMNRKSKLSNQNKIKIYKTIIRPVVTYAAPVWCNISKTTLIPLQRFQNKCLRFATGSGRYTKTVTLHDTANVEMLRAHINRLSTGFYRNRIGHNPLTNDITNTHKKLKRTKHKLPYSTLDLSD